MKLRSARTGVVGALAVAAVVTVSSFGAPGDARADATQSIANPGTDSAPAVSHDGRKIVFVTQPAMPESVSGLVLHDRGLPGADQAAVPSTEPISGSDGAARPGISGDGCIVVWSVPAVNASVEPTAEAGGAGDPGVGAADDPVDSGDGVAAAGELLQSVPARLVAVSRCGAPAVPPTDLLQLADVAGSFGTPAVSVDGAVVVVSTGTDIVRFERTAAGNYVETSRFDGPAIDLIDRVTEAQVGLSDDGSVTVFAAGVAGEPTDVFVDVVTTGVGTVTKLAGGAHPSVSGDGGIVAFLSGTTVNVIDRTATPLVPVSLGPGRRPVISADGNHVVIEGSGLLSVVSRTGQGTKAFDTRMVSQLATAIAPTSTGPVIDRLGTTVVSDLVPGPNAATDIAVTSLVADAGFDSDIFDLGEGLPGVTLTTTVSFSNGGPASVGVADLGVDGSFVIADDRCGAVIRPGTTCEVDVSFVTEAGFFDAFGVVTLTPTNVGIGPFTTDVSAFEKIPVVEIPTTTTPNSTGGSTTGSTSSSSSGGSSTGGTTRGGTTRGGTSTGGTTRGSTTRGSTTGGSTTGSTPATSTTTTVAPGAGVSASPATFDFAPTIIDAGRRTGLVEIVNNGSTPIGVVGVRLEPADSGTFEIVETACVGEPVAVAARCGVTLEFSPTEVGAQNVALIATLDGGVDITVPVTGTGAPAPVIAVVPGVATVGQVVTLSGSGFPTGITVEVTWRSSVLSVAIGDAGTFDLPVVVLPNTPKGPVSVSVEGQVDLFGTVTATMLVTATSNRSGPSVIDGIGVNVGR